VNDLIIMTHYKTLYDIQMRSSTYERFVLSSGSLELEYVQSFLVIYSFRVKQSVTVDDFTHGHLLSSFKLRKIFTDGAILNCNSIKEDL
jgi:hypothetical protein